MTDLISRQNAIDALIPIVKSASLRNRNVYSTAKKCLGAIEDLPSAERTGEWIIDLYEFGRDRYKCSRCKLGADVDYDYCPNCGARMVSE